MTVPCASCTIQRLLNLETSKAQVVRGNEKFKRNSNHQIRGTCAI